MLNPVRLESFTGKHAFPGIGNGRGKIDLDFPDGMNELDNARVQGNAAVRIGTGGSIFQIAFDDAAQIGQLAADLVVSAGQQVDFDEEVPLGRVNQPIGESG